MTASQKLSKIPELTEAQRTLLDELHEARDKSRFETFVVERLTELRDKLENDMGWREGANLVIKFCQKAVDGDDEVLRCVAWTAAEGVLWPIGCCGSYNSAFEHLQRDSATQLALGKVQAGAEYREPGRDAG